MSPARFVRGLVRSTSKRPLAARIVVHINSCGGEVSEGLAIYNVLKSHGAKVTTICEGFACSAASVVYMAGDERIMRSSSMLMIHNAWTTMSGNAQELRAEADALEKISGVVAEVYASAGLDVSGEALRSMLAAETWISPIEALEWGFATSVDVDKTSHKAAASVRTKVVQAMQFVVGLTREKPIAESSEPPEPPAPPPPNKAANVLVQYFNRKEG